MKNTLENGRAEFLAGHLSAAESLSRTNVENAVGWLLETGALVEKDKRLHLGPIAQDREARDAIAAPIREYLA